MNEIEAKRNEAFSAYEMYYARDLIADEPVKLAALQAGMLAEIALQLQGINEKVEALKNADMEERLAKVEAYTDGFSQALDTLNKMADAAGLGQ